MSLLSVRELCAKFQSRFIEEDKPATDQQQSTLALRYAIPPFKLARVFHEEVQLVIEEKRVKLVQDLFIRRQRAFPTFMDADALERFSVTRQIHLDRLRRQSDDLALPRLAWINEHLTLLVQSLFDLDNDEIHEQFQVLRPLIESDCYIREQVWTLLAEHPLAFNLSAANCSSMLAFRIMPFENCEGARHNLELCLRYFMDELKTVADESIIDKAKYLASALPLIKVEGGLLWALLVIDRIKFAVTNNHEAIQDQMIALMYLFCDSKVVEYIKDHFLL